ncbi:phage DNA packaging protein J [Oricola sp.]|nr:phage DNA packaging protein J [Oricola sp.]
MGLLGPASGFWDKPAKRSGAHPGRFEPVSGCSGANFQTPHGE